jgi:hypothetical protein
MVLSRDAGPAGRRRTLAGLLGASALSALAQACRGVGRVHPDVAEPEALPGAGARCPGADRHRDAFPQAQGLPTVFETLLMSSPSDGATS